MSITESDYKDLIDERNYYRSAFNLLGDLVWFKDIDGVFVRCNEQTAQLIGLDISEIIGKDDYDLFEKDRADYFRKIDIEAMFGSKPIIVREYLNAADGSFQGYFETIKAPMKDEEGNIIGVLGVARDISEITEKEKLLNQKSKMDAIGQLAGGIAHDFNNMLGAILGASEFIKASNEIVSEKNNKFLDLIISTAARSADLTAKLLAFSRKNETEFSTVLIHDIIEDVIKILQSTINKNTTISYRLMADNCSVLGDVSDLRNSFINLGINASHAMKEGGNIEITTQNVFLDKIYCENSSFNITPGNFIEIAIRDTGIGIPIENIERIFDPFFTTKDQGEGTGLGLASVLGMIKSHNGEIRVYSEVGVGSVFRIYLPLLTSSVTNNNQESKIIKGEGTILLVDDEETLRITGKATLEYLGYTVILASDGREALEVYRKKGRIIDLVISDMIMPVMNGSELFYKLKEIDNSCRMIIASGFTKDENLAELKKSGLLGFVHKPYKLSELSKIVAANI